MSITFIKKHYTCSTCGNTGTELFAISNTAEIYIEYIKENIPPEIKNYGIYIESILRDDYGAIKYRGVLEKCCEHCKNYTLVSDKVDNTSNVLNFYPQTEASKWADGFAKVGL